LINSRSSTTQSSHTVPISQAQQPEIALLAASSRARRDSREIPFLNKSGLGLGKRFESMKPTKVTDVEKSTTNKSDEKKEGVESGGDQTEKSITHDYSKSQIDLQTNNTSLPSSPMQNTSTTSSRPQFLHSSSGYV
jgi:hypothetical protein